MAAIGALVAVGSFDDEPSRSHGPPADLALDEHATSRMQGVVDELAAEAPGGIVAWVDTGKAQQGVAAGQADRRSDRPLTVDTAVAIGGVTDMVMATVALQLVEEGKLELDQPIAEVVPELAAEFEHGRTVTVRHLLGQTSGLASFASDAFIDELRGHWSVEDGVLAARCPQPDQGMDVLGFAAQQPPRFEPGDRVERIPTNDVVLQRVIEAVTDPPLARVYRERVLAPLGMDDTWLRCAQNPRAEIARGYAEADHSPVDAADAAIVDLTALDKPLGAPAAGLMSTGTDLATFTRALIDGRLFDDAATLEAMRQPHPRGAGSSYGLGLEVDQGILGASSPASDYDVWVRYYPTADVVIVASSNQAQPHSPPSREAVSGILDELTADSGG